MSSQHRPNSPHASTSQSIDLFRSISDPITIDTHYSDERAQQIARPSALNSDAAPNFMYGSPETLSRGYPAGSLSATSYVSTREGGTHGGQGEETSSTDNTPSFPHPSPPPRLGNCSITSPLGTATRRRGGSATAPMSSGIKRLTQHNTHRQTPPHEWSLFGQMMENEGQLPPSPSGASHMTSTSTSSLGGGWTMRTSTSNARSEVLQSPLEEVNAEEVFEVAHNGSTPSKIQGQEEPMMQGYDSAYDSDTSVSSQRTVGPSGGSAGRGVSVSGSDRRWFSLGRVPTPTLVQRNVLKCAIAYFIASLFTFSPTLSNFIGDLTSYGPGSKGPSPSAHMVATMYVFIVIITILTVCINHSGCVVQFTSILPRLLVL